MKKPIDQIYCKPIKDWVLIRERDELDPGSDLFNTAEGQVRLIATGMKALVTSLPDNIGVCEVIDLGPNGPKGLKKGDIAMIDFHSARRVLQVDREEVFLMEGAEFRCTLDKDSNLTPLPGYILTKSAPERMSVAILGTQAAILPESVTTHGRACRWTNSAKEVERAERVLGLSNTPNWRKKLQLPDHQRPNIPALHAVFEEVVALGEGTENAGMQVGDLVSLITEFAIKVRCKEHSYRLSELGYVDCVIDDSKILADSKKRTPVKQRPIRVAHIPRKSIFS